MRRLSFVIIGMLFALVAGAQHSPHGNQLSIDCSECHTTGNWLINPTLSTFNHANTGFELDGQHLQIDCKMCHLSLNFVDEKGKTECVSCHLDVHQQNLGEDCSMCHTPKSWIVTNINEIHANSRFPLVGSHATADCFECHLSENLLAFRPMGVECIDCHVAEYLATTAPSHQAAGYSTDCTECHTLRFSEWRSGAQNHDFFPLTEGHAIEDCYLCHTVGNFQTLTPDCESCHLTTYNATQNPPHQSLDFPVDCSSCHTTKPGWTPASFDIHNNFYVLEGAHALIATECLTCHTTGYVNTPNTCVGCHSEDYNSTSEPSHVAANFPTDCTVCHTQNAWSPSTFAHSTTFPLTQGHAIADCFACHLESNYQTLSPDCETCHLPDYNTTQDPPHATLDFPVNCLECHTTNPGWTPATFDIHNNYYVLEGAHALIATECAACHANGFVNTPNTCYACHTQEYNQTNDPPHASAQFSTECLTCHTQNAWSPSTFNHDAQYFPIYSGKHRNEWNTCAECHTNPNNYAIFSCIDCHEHNNQSEVNSDHNGVSGYQYNSIACLDCHPNGQEMRNVHHQNNIR